MARVLIKAGLAIDGEYELDASYFTNRELHLIKTEAKVRAGEVEDALQAGDNDLFVVLAYIALQRAGKGNMPIDFLWDAEAGKIKFDFTEDEQQGGDARPPEIKPESSETGNGTPGSSSLASSTNGEQSPESLPLSVTGDPG